MEIIDKIKRTNDMKKLPKYIGEIVNVIYVSQHNNKMFKKGKLKEVDPYINIGIEGTEIPFIGLPSAIIEIFDKENKTIYSNKHVYPFYNPYYFSNNGLIGVSHKKGEQYQNKIKKLSFLKNRFEL